MNELAPLAVRAQARVMELLAQLRLVPRGNVLLLLQLGSAVGKRARFSIGALTVLHE